MKTIKLLALFVVSSITFTSCSDDHDDHDHGDEEELITTVIYTLTNGNNVITLTYKDIDGVGGNAGEYSISGSLTANTTYNGKIKLLNETLPENDDEYNVTNEVQTESDEHEFFYTSNISGVSIVKTDVDGNNNPLGIETNLTTATAGSGSITIILKHQPTKPNSGIASAVGGSTDVEVVFKDVSVQ